MKKHNNTANNKYDDPSIKKHYRAFKTYNNVRLLSFWLTLVLLITFLTVYILICAKVIKIPDSEKDAMILFYMLPAIILVVVCAIDIPLMVQLWKGHISVGHKGRSVALTILGIIFGLVIPGILTITVYELSKWSESIFEKTPNWYKAKTVRK